MTRRRSPSRVKARGVAASRPAKARSGAPSRQTVARQARGGDVDRIRRRLARTVTPVPRWNADPDEVRRAVLKLVLTLVDLIRQMLERQALRRMQQQTLTADEVESVGLALMRLQATVADLAAQFDIAPEELNLDLGPVGKLL